jgi:hypothetical protein
VYQAGYDKGLAAGGGVVVDPDKIIEKTVTGTTIRVDDVSEIPHKCTLSVDKDSSVKVCGKNLWDEQTHNGYYDDKTGQFVTYQPTLSSVNPIVVNPSMKLYNNSSVAMYAFFYDKDMNWIPPQVVMPANGSNNITPPDNAKYMNFNLSSAYGSEYKNDVCIALCKTTYEPYRGTTYDVKAGQTIEVDSICPIMSIFNYNDATITFGYHKSWGIQSEYDRFWDAFQNNGKRTYYTYAFYGPDTWTDETYNPKYPIKVLYCNQMFANSSITDTKVPIDISESTINHDNLFIDSKIVTVRKLIVAAHNTFSTSFHTKTLENITFEGEIGNNISFSQCNKLTDASVQSIIDHLKDMSGATAPKLTFHADVGGRLTQAQKDAISTKNWTLVY